MQAGLSDWQERFEDLDKGGNPLAAGCRVEEEEKSCQKQSS